MVETEATLTKISDNSPKFEKHLVGIIHYRMEPFCVSCHFRELSLISWRQILLSQPLLSVSNKLFLT